MTLAPSRFHPAASDDLTTFPPRVQAELWAAIGDLEDRGLSHKDVDFWTDNTGRRLFRLTVREERGGTVDHRIFFDIEDGAAKIYGVFHRDEAYEPDVEQELTRRLH